MRHDPSVQAPTVERNPRPRPYRVRHDGWIRSRSRWRDHAGRIDQHQHDLLEGRVGDDKGVCQLVI